MYNIHWEDNELTAPSIIRSLRSSTLAHRGVRKHDTITTVEASALKAENKRLRDKVDSLERLVSHLQQERSQLMAVNADLYSSSYQIMISAHGWSSIPPNIPSTEVAPAESTELLMLPEDILMNDASINFEWDTFLR